MHPWIEAVHRLNRMGEGYVMVTILEAHGSTPRDRGTKMVVARDITYGTIGGGHLEFQAIGLAHQMLEQGQEKQHWETFPLGASLGQCCGGRVTLLFECFPGSDFNIMLFGAGHVGTALVEILKQLPCRLHWLDSRENQHSSTATLPENVSAIISESPTDEVPTMPAGSYYIILTYNHQLDFDILETVLKRQDARYVGLIGSSTKWKRFTARLAHKGYEEHFYQHVRCPIGLDAIPGKHPMEIAVSVAAEVIRIHHSHNAEKNHPAHESCDDLKRVVNFPIPIPINQPRN